MKIRLTFTEPVLGTSPNNPDIASEFIASKAPDAAKMEEEIAAIGAEAYEAKGMTIFPKMEDGTPYLYDYQIKGFFKDSCGMLARIKTTESSKIKAYKKIIDGLIFVYPRRIPLKMNGEMGNCQRPLRAQTAQGERVSLANSEQVPAGSSIEFEVETMDMAHEKVLREWFNYGAMRGIGQWRNSGMGRFHWDELDDDGNVIGGNKQRH